MDGVMYFEQSLNIMLNTVGENHTDTALYYCHLGESYGKLKDYDESFKNLEKSLKIYLNIHGENHPDTATI